MRHPEVEAEQAYITFAHKLLEKARLRAMRLRSMVEVGRGGTRQALYERDVIEEQVANRLAQLELGPASLVFGRIDHDEEPGGASAMGGAADGAAGGVVDSASAANGAADSAAATGAADLAFATSFYIGRLAVSDEQQEPVVVDWRARIAEPFFRATAQEPMGLLRRRHFTTRGAELLDIEDEIFELDHFFEPEGSEAGATQPDQPTLRAHGALYAALEERRSGQMRDVVATIQADQDEIVRSPMPGILIVQGGPGTGKTVVALHRAAYLLYTNRFPLAEQGLLVIGPNRLFLRYIERVLPSLGEVGAFQYVLADLFNELFPDVRVTKPETPQAAAVKGSHKMSEVLANAVALRQRLLKTRLRLQFRASYLTLTPQQSRQIISEARKRYSHHNAAARFVENSIFATLTASQPAAIVAKQQADELAEEQWDESDDSAAHADDYRTGNHTDGQADANTGGHDGVGHDDGAGGDDDDGRELADGPGSSETDASETSASETSASDLSANDLSASTLGASAARQLAKLPSHLQEAAPVGLIRERLGSHPSLVEAIERMWPTLSPAQFLRDLYGSPALLAASAKGLLSEQEQATLYRARGESDTSYEWSDSDIPLLDEAYQLLGPRYNRNRRGSLDPETRTFGHIVVDEAQDHSPMALRMIARRSLNGSMTLVGDIAQTTSPSAVADWDKIVEYLGERRQTKKSKRAKALATQAKALANQTNRRELTLSYRIAGPSLKPANAVLAASQPNIRPAQPVRINGPEPMYVAAAAGEDCIPATLKTIRQLTDDDYSVLVVSPPSLIDELQAAFEKTDLEFGRATATSRNATGALHQNVTLATVELVKGLETDAVVVVEPAAIVAEEPRGLGALYVALTRATRQIAVINALPLPEPLSAVAPPASEASSGT